MFSLSINLPYWFPFLSGNVPAYLKPFFKAIETFLRFPFSNSLSIKLKSSLSVFIFGLKNVDFL